MAMRLTKEQRVKAVQLYYQNNNNGAKAVRLLSAEFNIRQVQSRNITSLIRKFERTGSVSDAPRSGRPVSATNLEKSNEIRESLLSTPQKSSRRLSSELGISDRSVRRLLNKLKMRPYIPRLLESLHDGDADRRLEFCEIFLNKVNEDETFLDKIWWSDEATFKLNGHINRHNCVYWSDVNPQVILEKDVNLPGVTVWAAISSMGIIGPIFFDGTVNQDNYLHMLQTEFWPRVTNQNDIYFQQDGAPPHYGLRVQEWLNLNFELRWIGRRGAIEWPSRSPDLTPPDFFLWGVLKDLVYRLKPKTIPELKQAISDKFSEINVEMCQLVCRSVADRVQRCIEHEGEFRDLLTSTPQQYSTMISEYIHAMPNEDLAMILRNSGVKVGPITDTTRLVYERKLARIQQGIPQATAPADTTRLVYERKLARIQQGIPQATAPAGEFRDLLNSTARQYSMMSSEDIKDLTNEELATVLRNSGARVGPITDTTRLVYERKLVRIQQGIPPPTAPAEEEDDEEEDEEEEETTGSVYEEKPSARSYDLSTKLTRSVTRRSHRGASPPPDISLDKLPGSVHQKGSRKQRGKTQRKLSPEEQPFHLLPGSVPEKVKLRNHSVQNFVEMTPPIVPKPLPKSKLKSNIPRSSHPDYANSTVIHPDTNKSHTPRKSFGLSDSFHIYSTRSHPENNAKTYSEKEHVDDQNFVTACKETLEVNETDSDASMGSPQDSDFDNQFTDSPHDSDYDDHPADSFFPVKKTSVGYSPKPNFDFSQEMDSSELVYNTDEPTKQSEKFSSQIPRKWSSKSHMDDQKISPVFKKSNIPASHIGKSKSLDKAPSSKKSNSIWKLDPVEEQNIQRGLSESQTDSTNSSVRYDYLPKAFVEKYGKYMNQSGVGSTSVKKRQSIDSLLFQSNREQAKSSSTDSVARVKPEKLTSTYQRYTSPLISKISGGNNAPPSYIGTPGSSRMNTSLTRKPLSSMREEVQFTSLRNSQATSASAASAPKKKMSIMIKLFIMIVFGLIAWLIYINFESPAAKPLLTTNH